MVASELDRPEDYDFNHVAAGLAGLAVLAACRGTPWRGNSPEPGVPPFRADIGFREIADVVVVRHGQHRCTIGAPTPSVLPEGVPTPGAAKTQLPVPECDPVMTSRCPGAQQTSPHGEPNRVGFPGLIENSQTLHAAVAICESEAKQLAAG
jgi:hypothetical protein